MEWMIGKSALGYAYKQLRGNLLAFISGMSAANLVSMFFETRSMANLWGLTAKKTVIDRNTFGILEWTCSLVIGFIAFEVANGLMHKLNARVEKIGLFMNRNGLVHGLEAAAPRAVRSIRLLVGCFEKSFKWVK